MQLQAVMLVLVATVVAGQESWIDSSIRAKELREKGEPEAAEKLFRAALEEARKSGVEERSVFVAHNLALALIDQHKAAEAASLLETAVPVLDRSLGPNHVETVLCRVHLSKCYLRLGKYSEAESLILATLAPLEGALKANDALLASVLGELGVVYRETGRCAESEKIQLRALGIRKARYGKEARLTNLSVAELGLTYHCLGRYAEARQYLRNALARLEEGRPDLDLAAIWFTLGNAHYAVSQLHQAEAAWRRVLRILEEFPAARGLSADALAALGMLKQVQGKDKEAEELLTSAAELASRPPELTEHLAMILNSLGRVYGNRKEWERAEAAYTRAVALTRGGVGPWHHTLASILVNFGQLRIQQKRISEAAELYRQALEIDAKSLGDRHPYYAVHMEQYAAVLRKLNRKGEAQEWERKARAMADAITRATAFSAHTVDVRDLKP